MLQVSQRDLLAAIRTAGRVAKRSADNGVLIEFDGRDRLTVSGCSPQGMVTLHLEARGDKPVREYVPATTFEQVVRASSDPVELSSYNGSVQMAGVTVTKLPATEYVPWETPTAALFSCWAGPLTDALGLGCTFASTDQARPVLGTVAIEEVAGHVEVVATDTYRLIVAEALGSTVNKRMNGKRVLIPVDEAKNLVADLSTRDGIVQVAENEGCLSFTLPEVEWVVRKQEGDFPNWHPLVPLGEGVGTLDYLHDDLLRFCKRAEAVGATEVEFMAIRPGAVVSGKGDAGAIEEELASAIWIGPDVLFRVNIRYLRSVIDATSGGALEWRPDLHPVVARSQGRIGLVMPVRNPSVTVKVPDEAKAGDV